MPRAPRTATEYPEIPRRKLDFDFDPDSVPRDFYADDPVLTLVMTALSIVFPDGERFFVDSVNRFKDRINDPALAAAVKGFAAQEGMHSRAHAAFNAMARASFLDGAASGPKPRRASHAQGLDVVADLESKVHKLLVFRKKTAPPEVRLAVTCALEHFTAILAEQLLTDEEHREALHPSVRSLWVWHALEESEHKAVAFDVFQKVSGSYAIRARVMAVATLFFIGFITMSHVRLLSARGLFGVRSVAHTLNYCWGRPGIFRKLIPAYLQYYRPGFHPDDRDTKDLLASWKERLFGEAGSLKSILDLTAASPAH